LSDNGCPAEGGPNGSINENVWYNGLSEDIEGGLARLDELGSETTHPHFSNGWAMAFNTPFKIHKMNSAWESGTADAMAISWPKGLPARGEVRDAYIHVTDIVPTLYELMGITPPTTLRGAVQQPLEGVGMAALLRDPATPSPKHTQFYSMLGALAVWRDGWQANTEHAPAPMGWENSTGTGGASTTSRPTASSCTTSPPTDPNCWLSCSSCGTHKPFNGYPLDDRYAMEILHVERPPQSTPTAKSCSTPAPRCRNERCRSSADRSG